MASTFPQASLPPGRCPRCAFPPEACLCAEIPRLSVPYRFVILRHASEIPRLTNTGRWAAAALCGSVIHDHAAANATSDQAVAALLDDGPAALLFPSPHPPPPLAVPPRTIVVPDATWAQARRMVQRLAPLHALPRLGIPPPPGALRLRRPTVAGGMSTLEAIAGALDLLGEAPAAAALRRLHDVAVERTLRLKGLWPPGRNPHRPGGAA